MVRRNIARLQYCLLSAHNFVFIRNFRLWFSLRDVKHRRIARTVDQSKRELHICWRILMTSCSMQSSAWEEWCTDFQDAQGGCPGHTWTVITLPVLDTQYTHRVLLPLGSPTLLVKLYGSLKDNSKTSKWLTSFLMFSPIILSRRWCEDGQTAAVEGDDKGVKVCHQLPQYQ